MLFRKMRRRAELYGKLCTMLIEYRRWMAEFKDVAAVLDNINAFLDIAPSAFDKVEYREVNTLRENMRKAHKTTELYMTFIDGTWHLCSPKSEGAVKFTTEFVCRECNNTGNADSGGTYPWGEPAYIRCNCGLFN